MRRKIIDDYWLKYLNDLFGIKLITIRCECYNFLNLYGRSVLQHGSILNNFSL